MAVLRVENLSKSFGTRTLFSNVSFEIQPGEHVGLIGINGSGKTTLLRILQKQMEQDSGSFIVSADTKVSYVEQSPQLEQDVDLYHFALSAFAELLEIEQRLGNIAKRIEEEPQERTRLIALQDALLERFDREGGNTFRARTRAALLGLGFTPDELQRSVTAFSGGQISKAMLARAILKDADLLMLDEPTNNLDVISISWLEEYLKAFKGAVLLISHDRAFLDGTVTRILELTHERVQTGRGNYTAYLEQKMTAKELAQKQYFRQQKEIRRIEGIIEQQKRWNQARNYITIASKQKQIDRIKAEMVPPEKEDKQVVFRFPKPSETGNEVLVLKELAKSYASHKVFAHLNLLVQKGQCVCLIGENGCGKTTLLKIITGEEKPTGGEYRLGAGVKIGYYAQHNRDLDDSKTVLEELYDTYPKILPNTLRGYLGMFLFQGDDIHKVIGTLSGGERARIQLLKLVLSGANVLVLDEPTNHLDIASAEVLERAIEQFEGTVIIVSHDRYLVRRLADRVIILTSDGLIEQQDETEDMFERLKQPERKADGPVKDLTDNVYLRRKEAKTSQLQAKQQIRKIEGEIEKVEREIERMQAKMQDAIEKGEFQSVDAICKQMAQMQNMETQLYDQLDETEKRLESLLTEDQI